MPNNNSSNSGTDLAAESSKDLATFDTNYFMVATGILAFSVAFLKDIVNIENAASLLWLYIGWGCLAIAIGTILFSFFFLSVINNQFHTEIAKEFEDYGNERSTHNKKLKFRRLIEASENTMGFRIFFRLISIIAFIIGLLSLSLFIVCSLHKEKKKAKETKNESQKKPGKDQQKLIISPDTIYLKAIGTGVIPKPDDDDGDPIKPITFTDPPPPVKPKDGDPVTPCDPAQLCPSYVLQNVYFDFNKSALRPESYRELDSLANILKRNPDKKVEIAAHTDDRGADGFNTKLSQRRANSVVKYIGTKNIPESRMIPKGYGESRPLAANNTEFGRQTNRRVEFKYLN